MPGARWFPGSQLNYAENLLLGALPAAGRGAPARGDELAVLHCSELRDLDRLSWSELSRAGRRRRGRDARARGSQGGPRGGVHAQHPRDADRVPGGRQHRGDLVQRRTRVRGPQRDRPLRPDRAEAAAGGGRLPPRGQGLRPHGGARGDPGRAADRGARGRAALPVAPAPQPQPRAGEGDPGAWLGRAAGRSARAPGWSSSRCPSTTPCGCSTPRAPRGCRRRSCRGTAGSWWSS